MPLPKKTYNFTWRVEEFSLSCKNTGWSIDSPSFTVDLLGSSTYKLKLYPRGATDEKWVSLKLVRATFDDGPSRVNFGVKITLTPPDDCAPVTVISNHRGVARSDTVEFLELVERVSLLMHLYYIQGEEVMVLRCQMWEIPSDCVQCTEAHGRTRVNAKRVNDKVIVPRLESLADDDVVKHDVLLTDGSKLVELTLRNEKDELKMDVELLLRQGLIPPYPPLFLSIRVTILDVLGETFDVNRFGYRFDGSGTVSNPPLWSCPEAITLVKKLLADPDRLLYDGDLHLQLELAYSEDLEDSIFMEDVIIQSSPLSLAEFQAKGYIDMSQIDRIEAFEEKKGCDITLVSNDGKQVQAHKSVLCSKSHVFRRHIFSHPDHQDEGLSVLAVPGMDSDTLREFLLFLYTDIFEHMCFENAVRLQEPAMAYGVHSLVQLCDVYIKLGMVQEDLAELVEEGARCHPVVKRVVMDIAKRRRDILNDGESWVPRGKSDQLMEVYGRLANRRKTMSASRQQRDDLLLDQAQEWLDHFVT